MRLDHLKLTRRNLWRQKGYNGLNILGLAIGIACAGLIFLWVEDEYTFDNIHVNKDRLYQLRTTMTMDGNTFTMGSTPRPMAAALKTEIPGIANTARYLDEDQRLLVTAGDRSLYVSGRYCDASLFDMFSFHFIHGDARHPFPQPYSLVITESTAKKCFGTDKDPVGQAVQVNNGHDYVISGVISDPPGNSSLQFEWLAPYDILLREAAARGDSADATRWSSFGPLTYVELGPHANLAAINRQLKDYIRRRMSDPPTTSFLYPMKDWRLYDEFNNGKPTGGGRIRQVRTLSAIAWIILLIACINFMNLATSTSTHRAKEVGVRKVLGAERRRLVLQFLGEALFLSALATAVGVLIMRLSLPAFNELMGKHLLLQPTDPAQAIFLVSIALVCGLVAGSYPAFYLSSFHPSSVLKGMKIRTGGVPFVRKGLVVVQFAVSVVFIISTLVVLLQIRHIKNRELGFNKNNLLQVDPRQNIAQAFPLIKNELLQTGLIENVALADHETIEGGNTDDRFKWKGAPQGAGIQIAYRKVSPEYIATSGMRIVEGKDFDAGAVSEGSDIIVNESMARMLGPGPALGKIIESPRNPDGRFTDMTIVGVVGDYIYGNVYDRAAAPLILFCKPPDQENFLYVRCKPGTSMTRVLAGVEAVMKKNNPAFPLEFQFVDQQFNRLFQNETQTSKVSTVFAVLAIVISCLGLFGLSAYTAEQRTKEIGIRKVLGASVTGITRLLTGSFLTLVVVACLIAFPVAGVLMHHWLQDFEYRIDIGWWIYAAAGILAIAIALFTIGFQAMRAAMANPVASLRSE